MMKYLRLISVLCWSFVHSIAFAYDFGKVLCVGDSLTAGGSYNVSYRQDLYYLLKANGDQFNFVGPKDYGDFAGATDHQNRFAGFGGWTAKNLLEGNPNDTSWGNITNWLATYQPDTVVLMCGTNDFYELDNLTFTYTWDANVQNVLETLMIPRYNSLLAAIYNQKSNMRVVFMAPPKVLNGFSQGLFYAYTAHLQPLIADMTNQWASTNHRIRFADLWSFVNPSIGVDIGADGVHWIAAGGAKAGALVNTAFKSFNTSLNIQVNLEAWLSSYPDTLSFNIYNDQTFMTTAIGYRSGNSYVINTQLEPGTYHVQLKYSHWLNQIKNCTVIDSQSVNLVFNLLNGDVDNDNAVTVFDYGIISDHFDEYIEMEGWTSSDSDGYSGADTDLDGDGVVSVFDYGILSGNFDTTGD